MKLFLKNSIILFAIVSFIGIFTGCKTHKKKEKCNTCPKWSNVEKLHNKSSNV